MARRLWTNKRDDDEVVRRLNRRTFLTGAGTGAALVSGAGWLEACAPPGSVNGGQFQQVASDAKSVAIDPKSWPKGKTIAYIASNGAGETGARSINAAKSLAAAGNWKLRLFDSVGDNGKATQAISSYANQGVDGMILGILSPDAVKAGVRAAQAARIPVAGVFAGYTPDITVDVTANEWISASRVGTYALERLGGVGNGAQGSIVMLGSTGLPLDAIVIRSMTFHSMVKFSKGVRIVGEPATDFSNGFTSAKAQVLALLQKFPKGQLDCIWVSFGQMASTASEAVREAGREHDVFVVGDDGNLKEFDEIRRGGPQTATVANDLEGVTAVAMDALAKVFNGQKVPPVLYVDAPLITKANVPPPGTYPKGLGVQQYFTGQN